MSRAIKPVIAGALLGLMLAWSYPAEAQEQCYFVDMEKISEETVVETATALRSQGWFAITGDGEILYHPACLSQDAAIEQQATLEQLRTLRQEVDQLRMEVRQLLAIIEGVINTVGRL